ncbi:MAG: hypothetical protein AAGD04_05190 [Pseudomonadota bacterium]
MRRTLALIFLGAFAAGCTSEGGGAPTAAPASFEAPPPANISRRAANAASAFGISQAALYRSPTGCYSHRVRADGGYLAPLIDARGNQICDR